MLVDVCVVFVQCSVDVWVIWDLYLVVVEWQFGVCVVVNGDVFVCNMQYYFVVCKYVVVYLQVLCVLFDEVDVVDCWVCDYVFEVVV